MNVYEAITKRRTIRKFKQQPVERVTLEKLINAARVAPQSANLQPMKYIIVSKKELLEPVFNTCSWAAYIRPAGNPQEGEKPVAYIVVLCDTSIRNAGWQVDAGAAVENILLTAVEEGIGTCWLGAIDREQIKKLLNIPEKYIVDSMIALGYPAESPVAEEENGSIKYYKDENGNFHVPKRKMQDIVFYDDRL